MPNINIDFSYSGTMAILGVLLSLFWQYFPKVREWYTLQPDNNQRLIMLGCLVVLDCALFGLVCANIFTGVACTKVGAEQILWALLSGIVVNQGLFPILPNPNSAKPKK